MSNERVEIPVIMVAGKGTLGAPLCRTLEFMGGKVIPVDRTMYDFSVPIEAPTALLQGKPDIVINATSSIDGGPVAAFQETMMIGLNLMRACAVGGIRFIQIQAPPLIWPWENAQIIQSFMEAQQALQVARDAYVTEHELSSAIIQLPNLYDHHGRRADPISVIVAHVCKAAQTHSATYTIPFHQDTLLSLLHPDDAAAAVVSIGASGKEGACAVRGPNAMTCGEMVDLAARQAGATGKPEFSKDRCPTEVKTSWEVVDVPIKTPMDKGIADMVGYMMNTKASLRAGAEVKA